MHPESRQKRPPLPVRGQQGSPAPASRRRRAAASAIGAVVLAGVLVPVAVASHRPGDHSDSPGTDLSGRSLQPSDLIPGRYRLRFDLQSFAPAGRGPGAVRAELLVAIGEDGQVHRVDGLQTDLTGRPIQATRFDVGGGGERILDYLSCRLDRTEPPTALDAATFFSSVIGPLEPRAGGATSSDGEVAQTVLDGRDGILSSRVVTERNVATGELLTRIGSISLIRQSSSARWLTFPRTSGCRRAL
jgi:hypothetical protein